MSRGRWKLICAASLAASALLLSAALATAADRVALVIGNSAYQHGPKLVNPANDATAVDASLKLCGYQVTVLKDATWQEMARAVARWCDASRGAQSGIVFYAGHGIEVDGRNYLLPIDSRLAEKADLAVEAIGLDRLMSSMAASEITLKTIVLDACRNNPFPARAWLARRGNAGGLAEVSEESMAQGTLLVFSGAPGKAVPDGKGKNSPFSAQLSAKLATPNLSLAGVFAEVACAVDAGQEPWIRFDGSGRSFAEFSRFILRRSAGDQPATTEPEVSPDQGSPPVVPTARDRNRLRAGTWRVVENVSKELGGYEIAWDWTLHVDAQGIVTGEGHKVMVDGQEPTRGEKQAISTVRLRPQGDEIRGSRAELNYKGEIIRTIVNLRVSADGNTFSGSDTAGARKVGDLDGRIMRPGEGPRPPTVTKPPELPRKTISGRWRVVEKATPKFGNYLIVWQYDLVQGNDGWVTGTGRKISVDGKAPTRGERATISEIRFRMQDNPVTGTRVETNHRGNVLRTDIRLTLSEDLASFSGVDSQDGVKVSDLTASWQR